MCVGDFIHSSGCRFARPMTPSEQTQQPHYLVVGDVSHHEILPSERGQQSLAGTGTAVSRGGTELGGISHHEILSSERRQHSLNRHRDPTRRYCGSSAQYLLVFQCTISTSAQYLPPGDVVHWMHNISVSHQAILWFQCTTPPTRSHCGSTGKSW